MLQTIGNPILSNLTKWQDATTKSAEIKAKSDDSALYTRLLDSFTHDLEKACSQDGTALDLDPKAGDVKVVNKEKNEVLQLKKDSSTSRLFSLGNKEENGALQLTGYKIDPTKNTITCFEYDDVCVGGITASRREDLGHVQQTVLDLNEQKVVTSSRVDEYAVGRQFDSDDIIWHMRDALGRR